MNATQEQFRQAVREYLTANGAAAICETFADALADKLWDDPANGTQERFREVVHAFMEENKAAAVCHSQGNALADAVFTVANPAPAPPCNVAETLLANLRSLAITKDDDDRWAFTGEIDSFLIRATALGRERIATRRPPDAGGIVESNGHIYKPSAFVAALMNGLPQNIEKVAYWNDPGQAVNGQRIYDNHGNGNWGGEKAEVITMHQPREGIYLADGWVLVLTE